MNLPEPGTPEFEKLILKAQQQKPDYTKAPKMYPSIAKPYSGNLPVMLFGFQVVPKGTSPKFENVADAIMSAYGVPPHIIIGQRQPPQLDCTDIEAQRAARCVDWDLMDARMDMLERRIC